MANIALAELSDSLYARFHVPMGVRERETAGLFRTGLTSVDDLIDGFHRAAINELSGAASSNRTALAISVVAQALKAGECAAWIDAAGSFDPESAAESGVPLDRLLWINCHGQPEHALKATDLLLHGGGFGLMVLDLADISETIVRRIPLASWFRLRKAAEETGTALIVMTPAPQTRSCAALCGAIAQEIPVARASAARPGLRSRNP